MKAFLITAATVFSLVVAAHAARLYAEPGVAREPLFWATTALAVALAGWAWWLVWRMWKDRRG